jgi:hypothetical protein
MKRLEPPEILVLTDLDDTLFRVRRKLRKRDGETPERSLSVGSDGKPRSFAPHREERQLRRLFETALVVPVTARGRSGLRRCALPIDGPAVLAFGGAILLDDGTPDPDWRALVEETVAPEAGRLAFLKKETERLAKERKLPVRVGIVEEDGLKLFVSVKPLDDDDAESVAMAAEDARRLAPEGWTLHLNDVSLALIPPGISKERAASALLERLAGPDTLVIGAGDSLTDLPFMRLCDWCVIPSDAQILELLSGKKLP